jgi:Condensation domain
MTTRDPLGLLTERADAAPPPTLRLADHVRVAFAGQRGGDGPPTIGQASALGWVRDPAFYTRMVEWPLTLPPGTTLADIGAALRVLMARHESLRTCYPAGREPVQRVIRSGELVADVYQADAGPADRAALIVELVRRLRSAEFDLTAGLPVRVAVAMSRGGPAAAVILYSHAAVDFASMALIDREFGVLVSDPARRVTGPARHQPLDQAEQERSESGRRRIAAAVRGWEAALRTMPQCMYAVPSANGAQAAGAPVSDGRVSGGAVSGWLWSTAAALALPHIAARSEASPQQAVFAALCVVLGWRTGQDTCTLQVMAANRYQQHLRDYVGNLAQECIVSVDVRAAGLDEVVRRTGPAILRGTRHGLAEVGAVRRVMERVEHERGITIAPYCVFNDLSILLGDTGIGPPGADPAEASRALNRSRFALLPQPPADRLLLVMLQQVDGEMILGALTSDANRVPPGELEALLRGVESLLVAAAAGNADLSRIGDITGVQPVTRGSQWLRIGSSWIELPQVQRVLNDAVPGPAAAFAVPDEGGALQLVAYLAAGDGVRTPGQAHRACLSTLAGTRRLEPPDGIRYTAMTPSRYVICARGPAGPRDLEAWRRQTVLAEGDGRT